MTTEAVSRSSAANQNEEKIVRYTFGERINHWIGALSYIYLLMTGLAFWSPYLFWLAAVVGGGPTARFWHPWFGLIFTVSIFWTFKEWRGDMKIDDADRAWGKAIPDYIRTKTKNFLPSAASTTGKSFSSGEFSTASFSCCSPASPCGTQRLSRGTSASCATRRSWFTPAWRSSRLDCS